MSERNEQWKPMASMEADGIDEGVLPALPDLLAGSAHATERPPDGH